MRIWPSFLVIALALAGCSEGNTAPADVEDVLEEDLGLPGTNDTVAPPPPPGPVRFDGCTVQVVRMPVDEATARRDLPPGFDPVPLNDVPEAYNQVLLTTDCGGAGNDSAQFDGTNMFLIYYDVMPPEEYRDGESAGYRFLLLAGADGEDLQAGLAATGIANEAVTISGQAPVSGPHVSAVYSISAPPGTLINRVEGETAMGYDGFTLRFFAADDEGAVLGGFDFIAAAGQSLHIGPATVIADGDWDFAPNPLGSGFVYVPSSSQENLRLEPFVIAVAS